MKKRLLAFALTLILAVGLFPTIAGAIDINDSSVFLKQQGRSTCTLASTTMMLRRKAVLDADANWWATTEASVKKVAWSGGLAWNFTYNGLHVSVMRRSSGWAGGSLESKKQALIDLLAAHPEGIVGYSTSQPHAVLLTDYDYETGIFYCCDPAPYYPQARVPLTQSSIKGGSQDAILNRIDQLWYISSGISNGAGTDPWAIASTALEVLMPSEPEPEPELARDAVQEVSIDGESVLLQMYALTDEQGNDVNFVKLRDLAQALNGTAAQFDVGYDGAVTVTTNVTYHAADDEVTDAPFQGDQPYTAPAAITIIDGVDTELDAIQLTDDQGGGHIYYNLRDLGQILGYQVGWDAETGICINTDQA